MSLFDDYRSEAQFANDYPFGVPCETWRSKQGKVKVADMTEAHIRNAMRIVGEDDAWYWYFLCELRRRGKEK